jgi:hypothetical protein
MIVLNGKMIEPKTVKTCVLYDSSDGRIIHTHQAIILPGAAEIGDADMESTARTIAKSKGLNVSKAKTLHVSSKKYDLNRRYKVDTKSKRLIQLQPQKPTSKSHKKKA